MVIFLNETETIGIIISNASTTMTGSIIITMMVILLVLVALCVMFGIEIEYASIILLPLLLSWSVFKSEFIPPLFVLIVYIALVMTKNFLFK